MFLQFILGSYGFVALIDYFDGLFTGKVGIECPIAIDIKQVVFLTIGKILKAQWLFFQVDNLKMIVLCLERLNEMSGDVDQMNWVHWPQCHGSLFDSFFSDAIWWILSSSLKQNPILTQSLGLGD